MAVAILALAGAGAAADGTAGGYRLGAVVVGPGGTAMHGGGWTLDGSVGQPVTGRITATPGMELDAGFWSAIEVAIPGGDLIFANGFDPPP